MPPDDAFIAEFTLSSPEIRGETSFIPEVELEMVDQYREPGGHTHGIFWVEAPVFPDLEEALSKSHLVADWECLVERQDQQLYNITVAPEGGLALTVEISREYNVVWQRMQVRDGRFWIRAIVPDRDALTGFYTAIREEGYEFSLEQVTSDIEPRLEGEPLLSDRQREALVLAYKRGYYEQPRKVTLKEIGEELGISESAVSGRLCRGMSTVLSDCLWVEETNEDACFPS